MLIAADTVVTPERILRPGWVELAAATIRTVGEGAPPGVPDHDLGPAIVAPGFVDMHAHGGGGASFMDGADAARTVLATHLQHGTTTMMASLVTDTIDRLAAVSADLAPLVEAGELVGIHLEGPWLSGLHCGAHDPELLRDPTITDIETIRAASRDTIRMVTLAPERRGALDAVRHLAAHGVIPALGHSHAGYDEAREALVNGAGVITHIYNAMRPLHHREPGLPGAAMTDDAVFVEAIADGVHLHPAVVGLLLSGRPARTVLVSDAMGAAGSRDGRYRLGPLEVDVVGGVARLVGNGAIAGSTLTLDAAVRYSVHEAGASLHTAVLAATLNPADALGLSSRGRIAPGADADLVVLGMGLDVRGVLRSGRWVRHP